VAGGGIYAYDCTTRLTRAHVVYNAAGQGGGGLCIWGTGLCAIADCTIEQNTAAENGKGGGLAGLWAAGACNVDNTLIVSNSTLGQGGGVYWQGGGVVTMGNGTRIADNAAHNGTGGGAQLEVQGMVTLAGVEIARNRSGASGGGLLVQTGSVACTECVIADNMASLVPTNVGVAATSGGGGAAVMLGAALHARNSTWRNNIVSNAYGSGGAILALGAAVTVDSTVGGGPAGVWPRTRFIGSHAGVSNSAGGAILAYNGGSVTMAQALLASNSAMNGGALALQDVTVSLENLVVAQHRARNTGSGLYVLFPRHHVLVRQCTIADNDGYGGFDIGGGTVVLQNCTLWGNGSCQITPWSDTAMVSYCDIEGGYSGAGTIDSNPVFIAAAALNYDIAEESPCRDSGMNLPAVTNDCIGTPRPYGAGWDMGAYEFVPEPGGVWGLALFTIYNLQFTIWRKRGTQ